MATGFVHCAESKRFAAEAQYLEGWLDFNRGKYRESLPALSSTVARFNFPRRALISKQ